LAFFPAADALAAFLVDVLLLDFRADLIFLASLSCFCKSRSVTEGEAL